MTGRRSEEHTSELQSHDNLVCRLLLEKKKKQNECPLRRRARPPPQSWCSAEQAVRAATSVLFVTGPGCSGARPRWPGPVFFFKRTAPPETLPSSPTARLPF